MIWFSSLPTQAGSEQQEHLVELREQIACSLKVQRLVYVVQATLKLVAYDQEFSYYNYVHV